MSRAELIYSLRASLERELSRIDQDPHNSGILVRYYKVTSSRLSLASQVWELKLLRTMSCLLGKRFEDLVFKINLRHSNPNSQNKYRKVLKSFYRWLAQRLRKARVPSGGQVDRAEQSPPRDRQA